MKLIPFQSTHLRLLVDSIKGFTVGRVYSIEEWEEGSQGSIYFQIRNDNGEVSIWYYFEYDPEVEDASFEVNLQNILKE